MPAVERLLKASRSQVDVAYTRYLAAHDALVVSRHSGICNLTAAALLPWLAGERWPHYVKPQNASPRPRLE